MAQTFAYSEGSPVGMSLATPHTAPHDAAGLSRLPSEWRVVDRVALADVVVDHVVVGPNGMFTIVLDPDPTPADLTPDGLFRGGERVTAQVKAAVAAAHDLRAAVGLHVFAYPLLVAPITGERSHLDRLGVVPGERIAEAIWSHPGRPMRRSQRLEAMWALRHLGS